ncbi:hypothetical protein [Methylomicrobium lacus]|uniref:hypothetical protein n=1 Tax=Methylomicrobium lacus TaxID=136992 RepID=UPI0035A908EF
MATAGVIQSAGSAFAVVNPTYEDVKTAIDTTPAKVEDAITALNKGTDNEEVGKMVSDARQTQKDIANNVLDVKRNRASGVLNADSVCFEKFRSY